MTESSSTWWRAALLGFCLGLGAATPATAQVRDSVAAPARARATMLSPPLSPRRAFLYSLVVPGYAQSVLGRDRTGAVLMAFEAAAVVMIREKHNNVREARRNLADSVAVSYVNPDGTPGVRFERTNFSSDLLRVRREQAEDWIAVLVANHLFAAADAYVAALLWDLPAEIAVQGDRSSRRFGLRLRW